MKHDLVIRPIKEWYHRSYPLVIGGPCSAEDEKQVMATAEALSAIPLVGIFRAGIWKPRTRPSDFEGVGMVGLKWLQKAKEATGLMTAVEIGQADHVKACIDHQVDIIWIGARTVVNPFSMQEIADVLQDINMPVFVKNPVTPDVKLWLGAIERINRAGINRLVAVHRGFYAHRIMAYRNDPMWEIPIEMKRMHPELPMICDPSHISGRRELIREIAQYALDLDMDGLMIESHVSPDEAKTDKEQQVTPLQLEELLGQLRFHKGKAEGTSMEQELKALRNNIDRLDTELINALARRMELVKRIGLLKKKHQMTAFQVKRWQEIRERFIATGTMEGLDEKFLETILDIVHKESIRLQSDLFGSGENP